MSHHKEHDADLEVKRKHSASHIMTAAVQMMFGKEIGLGVGPWTDEGFYQDFDFGDKTVTEKDFKEIEKKMRWIVNKDMPIKKAVVKADEARKLCEGDPYKTELIEEIIARGEDISFYYIGESIDKAISVNLCAGPHLNSTGELGAFKLMKTAGAYWRGDEKKAMLTRIYGVAFAEQSQIDDYLNFLEEAKKRDHRKLGEELDLFHFDEAIGKGLPIWLPKGNVIKEELEKWAKETEAQWGYQRVTTPIITKEDLFYTSGHLPLYKDSMYAPIQIDDDTFYIKPMNCPFHHKCFAARPKSYRELPVRYAEYGWCHRYEDSGSLFGLMRVRGMQMNDAHIYIQKEHAVEEFIRVIQLHEYYYKVLGIDNYEMELALRDPKKMDKYHGDEGDWKDAEQMTIEAMERSGVPYKVVNEGAAFYGPKMDFQIFSSIGRSFTASTNQLDLFMGKQFNLEYVDKDGQKKVPAVIHRAPLGTHERFIGFLIEHFAGNFPTWLSPVQAVILPIGEKHTAFADEVVAQLKKANIRVELSEATETLGKRVRTAKMQKVPYMLVIGDAEVDGKSATLEHRELGKVGTLTIEAITERLTQEIQTRALKPTV